MVAPPSKKNEIQMLSKLRGLKKIREILLMPLLNLFSLPSQLGKKKKKKIECANMEGYLSARHSFKNSIYVT